MLRADLLIIGVEILEVAAARVHGADGVANLSRVEQIEIDERKQRLAQRLCVVNADLSGLAGPTGNWRRHARLEKARHAESRGHRRAGLVKETQARLVPRDRRRQQPARCLAPEPLQPLGAQRRRIAADDRAIDRANRNAGHPVDFEVGSLQRVIGAGLIGAESAASLQHQRDFFLTRVRHGAKMGWRERSLEISIASLISYNRGRVDFQANFCAKRRDAPRLGPGGFSRERSSIRAPRSLQCNSLTLKMIWRHPISSRRIAHA